MVVMVLIYGVVVLCSFMLFLYCVMFHSSSSPTFLFLSPTLSIPPLHPRHPHPHSLRQQQRRPEHERARHQRHQRYHAVIRIHTHTPSLCATITPL
jgi:hypothetical protein